MNVHRPDDVTSGGTVETEDEYDCLKASLLAFKQSYSSAEKAHLTLPQQTS
jgi:hypothetical protein